MPDEESRVKCIECGFLAMRWKPTRELREAERHPATGRLQQVYDINHPKYALPNAPSMDSELYERTPICFMAMVNFYRPEIFNADAGHSFVNWDPVYEGRECSEFTPHQQGLTPKEHREMLDRQWRLDYELQVRQAVDKREDDRDKAMNDREDARDKRAEEWHREDLNTLKGQHRWQLFWFGAAVIVATILGSLIEAQWIGKPW